MEENNPEFVEIYRLRIENKAEGKIEVSQDSGKSWTPLGKVIRACERVANEGFTASKWAISGRVCATSVNAIHIKTDNESVKGRGIVFSLVPAEQLSTFKYGAAATNPNAAIYTDIPGGTGLFGQWTPFINGRVLVERGGGTAQPLAKDYQPRTGDVLTLPVERVKKLPQWIEFENRFGGLIRLHYSEPEETKIIGEVLRPVLGVGRFEGSLFAEVGRIRANHPGVIDISTSPYREVGGFQIVPANHAMSPETTYVRQFTQWMVVGPLKATDPSWEGTAPLFSYYIQPHYDPGDLYSENWLERLLNRFRVEVRMNNGEWRTMPAISLGIDPKQALPEKAFTALREMTHLRIVFPNPLYYGPVEAR